MTIDVLPHSIYREPILHPIGNDLDLITIKSYSHFAISTLVANNTWMNFNSELEAIKYSLKDRKHPILDAVGPCKMKVSLYSRGNPSSTSPVLVYIKVIRRARAFILEDEQVKDRPTVYQYYRYPNLYYCHHYLK